MKPRFKIAIVEDHDYWRQTLADLIKKETKLELTIISTNGSDFIKQLEVVSHELEPEIVITDLSMPLMDGFQVSKWLQKHRPKIKVIALTLQLNLATTVQLLNAGVKGILDKNITADTLFSAIQTVLNNEFYFSMAWSDSLNGPMDSPPISELAFALLEKWNSLKENEKLFVSLCCSERSFKEIATQMNIRMDVLENIRSKIFALFQVTGRIGLVKLVIQNRLLDS